ncbi:NAD(P)H-quinone oxidoreductase subunit J [Synechococcus sp. M16CYN]|uniref:NAD(P)H-quinone oxidoreductase subunit J n=1 Tax=Synechococcus sp. M16CYN TaxID=3103139 RepID=UPI003243629F
MSEVSPSEQPPKDPSLTVATSGCGAVSQWLSSQNFHHDVLEPDHIGIEQIGVEPAVLPIVAAALKSHGFDYLQCQGGYDEGPGERLVCFYHFLAMAEQVESTMAGKSSILREVRLKVFLSREGTPSVPSIYGLFRGADWQEREIFDMYGIQFEGHPHPKRLLMPEDWKGWPLRKDYVQPDFYEMQDAY